MAYVDIMKIILMASISRKLAMHNVNNSLTVKRVICNLQLSEWFVGI